MPSHVEFIINIRKLLLNQPAVSDQQFIEEFQRYLPEWDQFFRFRTFRIIDWLSDEYYEEYQTPLAIFHFQRLKNILNSHEEQRQKRRQIIELLTTETITAPQVHSYYQDVWKTIRQINYFYFQAQAEPESVNIWQQILNGSLLGEDDIAVNPQLPRKVIEDFAELFQALGQIDQHAVELLKNCIEKTLGDSAQEKIEFVFELLGKLFDDIQTQEYQSILTKEQRYIQHLYHVYVPDPQDITPENFERLCQAMIYEENFQLPHHYPGISRDKLYYLHRDIRYLFVKEDIMNAGLNARDRLNRLAAIMQDLSSYCGCTLPLVNNYYPPGASKREQFYHADYSAPRLKPLHHWENLITPLELQKRRSRTLNVKDVANLLSAGLALGEGAVAAMGNYQMLTAVSPLLAMTVAAPTLTGSMGCNYAIVIKDTETTLDAFANGFTQLHTNDKKVKLSSARIALLWILSLLPSAISGACFGALGGLSATTTLSIILGLAGVSMIPGVGWAIFSVVFTVSFFTVFSILFKMTGRKIANAVWADLQNFFHKRFYWPETGRVKAVFDNFFSFMRLAGSIILITGLLFLTSAKVFATSLTAAFIKFSWGGAAAEKLANTLSYINSSLWLYFNFQKGSTLFDLLYSRGVVKIIPYVIESAMRLPYAVMAIGCLFLEKASWLFSKKFSDKCAQWFEDFLEDTAPKFSSEFINKKMHGWGRTHSGIDEIDQDRRPLQLIGGIIKSTLSLCKLIPYVPEICLRFGLGMVYKALWPIRKLIRITHHFAQQRSPSYQAATAKIPYIKSRYRESHMGEILVPKFTHYLSTQAAKLMRKVRDFFHNERPITVNHSPQSCHVKIATHLKEQVSTVAIASNSFGQAGIFAEDGSADLPNFLKSSSMATNDITTGGPQLVCSGAINNAACQSVIGSSLFTPLSLFKKNQNLSATAEALVTEYKTEGALARRPHSFFHRARPINQAVSLNRKFCV